jgi:hypothetical protein
MVPSHTGVGARNGMTPSVFVGSYERVAHAEHAAHAAVTATAPNSLRIGVETDDI